MAIYYSAPTIAPAYQDSRNPLVLGVKLTNDNLVSMLTETSCGLEARYENGPDMTNVGFGDDARGVIPPKSARNIACNLQDDLNIGIPDPAEIRVVVLYRLGWFPIRFHETKRLFLTRDSSGFRWIEDPPLGQ